MKSRIFMNDIIEQAVNVHHAVTFPALDLLLPIMHKFTQIF